MAQIKSSKNYDNFKFHEANRDIDPSHLNNLMKSIKRNNLLHENPMKVQSNGNGTYTILDGQHRFAIATLLDTKIYFIVTKEMTMDDVPSYQTSKKWGFDDFLKHFCHYGKQDYKIYAGFKKQSGWSHNCLISLLAGNTKGNSLAFKNGTFKITRSIENANKLIGMVNDYQEYTKYYKQRSFVTAVLRIINGTPEYDHSQMMKKLAYLSEKLVKCVDVEAYLRLLESIYNYKTTGNYVRFL